MTEDNLLLQLIEADEDDDLDELFDDEDEDLFDDDPFSQVDPQDER